MVILFCRGCREGHADRDAGRLSEPHCPLLTEDGIDRAQGHTELTRGMQVIECTV